MKETTPLFRILVLALSIGFQAQAQDPFTNGLVAYYPFNGNANDASGYGNNGAVTNAMLTADRWNIPNGAYAFNGSNSVIWIEDSPSLRIALDITVACWVQPDAGLVKEVRMVGKATGINRSYGLWCTPLPRPAIGDPYWLFQQFIGAGGGIQENTLVVLPSPLNTKKWYSVVGVRSGNQSFLYIDGKLVAATSHSTDPVWIGSDPLLIGNYLEDPYLNDRYQVLSGSIDDIRIYNRALSSSEVTQLYAIESGPKLSLIRAVKPSFSGLWLGTNFQLQVSSDLFNWTNQGPPFTATNTSMVYPQYWDVDNWGQLFFRLQVTP